MVPGKLLEAFVITVYALLLNLAALAVGTLLFVGPGAIRAHQGFSVLLIVFASVAVFGTALVASWRGPIDTPSRGLRVGLCSAGVFYAILVVLFGLVPTLAYLPTGDTETAFGYLGDVLRITVTGSRGLPLLTGALGGALYGWLRGRIVGNRRR